MFSLQFVEMFVLENHFFFFAVLAKCNAITFEFLLDLRTFKVFKRSLEVRIKTF